MARVLSLFSPLGVMVSKLSLIPVPPPLLARTDEVIE
jgi:hypothetical protein